VCYACNVILIVVKLSAVLAIATDIGVVWSAGLSHSC